MRSILTAAAIFLPLVSASAADEPFTFMGHAIGDPLAKWKSSLDINDTIGWCKKPNELGVKRCNDKSLKKEGLSNKIGTAYVNWLYWIYLDDKLAGFELSGQWADVEALRDMLIGKFGRPDEIGGDTWTWHMSNGPLVLEQDRGKSLLHMFDEASLRVVEQRQVAKKNESMEAGKRSF
ncbi:hypothetical protein [Azospirillum thermophilum]|uniref:hypothetical protein n=1 Tax=Azospirillum thermophilum TaxID=2202148 RepID=UPI0011B3DD9E|nr:hypothetical protein [Azospirillum thermophilum]